MRNDPHRIAMTAPLSWVDDRSAAIPANLVAFFAVFFCRQWRLYERAVARFTDWHGHTIDSRLLGPKPAVFLLVDTPELAPAEAKLAADTRALEACRARSGVSTSKKTAASPESPAVNRVTVPV